MNKGYFERGHTRHTPRQLKVHQSTLSEKDKQKIRWTLIETLSNVELTTSYHVANQIAKGKVTYDESAVEQTVYDFMKGKLSSIIELNQRDDETRVLLRDYRIERIVNIEGKPTKCNLCIVINIFTGEVVTMYWNATNDTHSTIDMRRYVNKNRLDFFK